MYNHCNSLKYIVDEVNMSIKVIFELIYDDSNRFIEDAKDIKPQEKEFETLQEVGEWILNVGQNQFWDFSLTGDNGLVIENFEILFDTIALLNTPNQASYHS